MSEQTKIEWCDSTLNFWSGCTKVSAGCANCYAETLSDRKLTDAKGNLTIGKWGKGAPRKLHESAFKQALALNRKPWMCDECGAVYKDIPYDGNGGAPSVCSQRDGDGIECGSGRFHRRRIFSLSLGDWLDPEVPVEWLARMLDTIRQCDQVTWILCTKRPEDWYERISKAIHHCSDETAEWLEAWTDCVDTPERGDVPPNIILLASVENQAMADKRVPELLRIPAACRGLSLEPLLGPVDLTRLEADESMGCTFNALTGFGSWNKDLQFAPLSWLIVGGESGPGARPCNVEWIRSLVAQGEAAGVATFVKQFGANVHDAPRREGNDRVLLLRHKKGGDWDEWPADLRVREWPSL